MGEWMEWRFYGNYGKRRIRKYQVPAGERPETGKNEQDQWFGGMKGMEENRKPIVISDPFR